MLRTLYTLSNIYVTVVVKIFWHLPPFTDGDTEGQGYERIFLACL